MTTLGLILQISAARDKDRDHGCVPSPLDLRYPAAMDQTMSDVLDPTAHGSQQLAAIAAAPDSLRGRVLGIRADRTWQSFQRFADVVQTEAIQQWGVRNVVRFDPGVRIGTTDEERQKVAGFVRAVDVAIVGLGT